MFELSTLSICTVPSLLLFVWLSFVFVVVLFLVGVPYLFIFYFVYFPLFVTSVSLCLALINAKTTVLSFLCQPFSSSCCPAFVVAVMGVVLKLLPPLLLL